jgi:hypothetical protein
VKSGDQRDGEITEATSRAIGIEAERILTMIFIS